MRSGDNLAISVPAGPGAAVRAIAAAHDYCDRTGCDDDARAHIAIIVEELVLNIVEHGGAALGDPIHILLEQVGEGTQLTLTDGGTFFDPREAEAPGLAPPERGGGAGIALILAWAEIRSYVAEGGRNRMVLLIPAR
ncbi:Anti-sigma regulatory factor (Ser/Thr protein kinase) [Sphingomonas laterariae]|uniref:Anti-sigma regulatory factor (Ser/Thr protein kinase) n=1 Tax=Edaphosphingomonas laterariae TaxID=861865 RepID=A0A239E197_9SPHN|nr:ATP-binding protein [Sphingomonas laterariae]SNS38279.1 Anti-sigma regulatory factor (Ser/Thr protein kinase) [Sphingomonas laterariae]